MGDDGSEGDFERTDSGEEGGEEGGEETGRAGDSMMARVPLDWRVAKALSRKRDGRVLGGDKKGSRQSIPWLSLL